MTTVNVIGKRPAPAKEEADLKPIQVDAPNIELKFDELKADILSKIDREMTDSQNTREYIANKYDELCKKIQSLTELDATVNGFRSDVKVIEKQIVNLASRVDEIERRVILNETPSLAAATL